jgi:hypothetical protein
MLLEELKARQCFTVGDMTFKLEKSNKDTREVHYSICDDSGLCIGKFSASCCDENDAIEYDDSDDDGTLERLRKSGYSDAIARNVRSAIDSIHD